jgi:hypothetical protein
MFPYQQGQQDASAIFGVTKTAEMKKHALSPKTLRRIKSWLPTAKGVKRFFIGEPKKFVRELKGGRALSKGSLIREGFTAPDLLSKAMFYGLPALDVVSVARSDSPDKPGDIGSILGGTVGGMAAYRPFGLVGSILAGMGGSALGRGIVSAGRAITNKPVQQPQWSPQLPAQYAQTPYENPAFETGLPESLYRQEGR